jgi:hypothetical protein
MVVVARAYDTPTQVGWTYESTQENARLSRTLREPG